MYEYSERVELSKMQKVQKLKIKSVDLCLSESSSSIYLSVSIKWQMRNQDLIEFAFKKMNKREMKKIKLYHISKQYCII